MFVSRELYNDLRSTLLLDDMSDHMPSLLTLPEICPDKKGENWRLKCKFDKKAIDAIKKDLQDVDWDSMLSAKNCNDNFNLLHDYLTLSIDNHAPEKMVRLLGKKSVQPWITKGLKRCISKQHKLYELSMIRPVSPQAIATYKAYKCCLQQMIRNSKRLYYSDQCNKHRSNTKRLWQLINEITKKETNKTNIVEYLTIENIKVQDSKEIANAFADYFANIGKNYAESTAKPTCTCE